MDFIRSLFRWAIFLGIVGGIYWGYLQYTSKKKAQEQAADASLEAVLVEEEKLKEKVKTLEAEKIQEGNKLGRRYSDLNIEIYWNGPKGTFQYDLITNNRLQGANSLTADQRSELLDMEATVKSKREALTEAQAELDRFQKAHPEIREAARKAAGPRAPWEAIPSLKPKTTSSTAKVDDPPVDDHYNPVGKTEDEIIRQWGQPTGRMEFGDELKLTFKQGTVSMKNGRATEFIR